MGDAYHFYLIPRSTRFVRNLHNEECFSLRPWSAGDGQIRGIVFGTSCDASFVYATIWDDLIEIDVEDDIGRYRTIQSRQLTDVSATILNGRTALFWLDGESSGSAYKWTRGDGGPGSKDTSVPFLGHCGVEFVALTVSNDVGWLSTAWTPKATVWQVDLIAENVLAVFDEAAEAYDIRARPDGGLWATLAQPGVAELVVEVWEPVFEFRPNAKMMMSRSTPII